MASYAQSTQKAHWTFATLGDVEAIRAKVRSADMAAAEAKDGDTDDMMTEEETRAMEAIYLDKIRSWCLDPKFARKMNERLVVSADDKGAEKAADESSGYAKTLFWTAAMFFKRFYLRNSMAKHNPFIMRAAAVYVAGKVEEIPLTSDLRGVRVDKLGALANTAPEMIVENEIGFLGGIDFELAVFSPQRPLEGLLADLRAKHPRKAKTWRSLEAMASTLLQNAMYTDLVFVEAPSRLAFAALLAAHGEVKKNKPDFSVDELFTWLLPEGIDPPAQLKEDLAALGQTMKETKGLLKTYGKLLRASDNAARWVREWTKHCAKLPANTAKPLNRKRKRESGEAGDDEGEDEAGDGKSAGRVKTEGESDPAATTKPATEPPPAETKSEVADSDEKVKKKKKKKKKSKEHKRIKTEPA